MRALGIETSTQRGSVALFEGNRVVLAFEHDKPNAHAEMLLPLVQRLFAETGAAKTSLERVVVGTGPGSFTGLRIGIALGEGIALGVGVPLVGVCSLEALARAPEGNRPRVAVLDAGRGELFVAAYAPDGAELIAPSAIPLAEVLPRVAAVAALENALYVGAGTAKLGGLPDVASGSLLDLPHARTVVSLGVAREPAAAPPDPIYVRGAGATPQNLPPSPLEKDP